MLNNILETINQNGIIIMIVSIAYFNILIHFKYYRKIKEAKLALTELVAEVEKATGRPIPNYREVDKLVNDIFKPKKKPKFNPSPRNQ